MVCILHLEYNKASLNIVYRFLETATLSETTYGESLFDLPH